MNDIQKNSSLYGNFQVIYHNREPEGRTQSSPTDMMTTPNDLIINDNLPLKSIDVFHEIQFAKCCMLIIDGETKIAFSGDRAFHKDHFAECFTDYDFLIHEATFPDSFESSKKAKEITKHCYELEAVETVNLMKLKIPS